MTDSTKIPIADIIASAGENLALEVGREYMVPNGEASMKVCTTDAQEYHMKAKEGFTTEWKGFQSKVSDETDWESVEKFVRLLVLEEMETEEDFETAFKKIRRIVKFVPTKANIISCYSRLVATGKLEKNPSIEKVVLKKGIRSNSGVVVITVVSAPGPFSCPQDCAYCPNEPGQPRSYLSTEPAVARANQNKFDPVRQVYDRAATLARQGHKIDKIEIIVLGGTWSNYPWEYQQQFCRDIFFAANTFNEDLARSRLDREVSNQEGPVEDDDMPCVALQLDPKFNNLSRPKRSLAEEQELNEGAECKIIGLTLETRPDHISPLELRRLRSLGCTRVQIGVQHTDDEILRKINRGCTTADAVRAVKLLKQHCFKVDIHLMPDLPFSSVEADIDMFDFVLDTEHLQADHWKIYPCEVTPFSAIEDWHAQGAYKPYTDVDPENLVNLLVHVKAKVHPWIRLNRVIRDIPVESIIAGNNNTNLRQEVYRRLAMLGLACRCIRCREVRAFRPNEAVVMRRRDYRSSEGDEIFLTFEGTSSRGLGGGAENRGLQVKATRKNSRKQSSVSTVDDQYDEQNAPLYALLRLRFNDDMHAPSATFPELDECALIRELHVYGVVAPSRKNKDGNDPKVQHTGYGRRLMAEAERLAHLRGYKKIAVIAGIGVRNYYRKLGYELRGLFMVKNIDPNAQLETSEVIPFGTGQEKLDESTLSLWEGVSVNRKMLGVGSALLVGGLACFIAYKRFSRAR
jgi:ELP3 family radical SAM enzyme/protein acetyltransferase